MKLEVEALGVPVVRRQLLAMAGRAADPTPALDDIVDGVLASAAKQFDSEGGHGGTPWAPILPSTVERKQAAGLDPRILHATNELRQSLTARGGANVAIVRRDGVTVDTTVPYAKYHKAKRPMIVPTEIEKRGWVKTLQAHIVASDRSSAGLLAGVV